VQSNVFMKFIALIQLEVLMVSYSSGSPLQVALNYDNLHHQFSLLTCHANVTPCLQQSYITVLVATLC